MIYVVMGMHKSGTTLVANLVHHAGINMIDEEEFRDYEHDGFYERQSTYKVNLALLNLDASDILFFKPPAHLALNLIHRQTINEIIETYTNIHADWGFKDPRTCLTYPLWEQVLPTHRIIIIFRPVEDMWKRFQYNGLKFWNNIIRAIALVMRWCEHNQRLLDIWDQTPYDTLILSYRAMMRDNNELRHLEVFLDRPLTDVRNQSLNCIPANKPTIINFAIIIVRLFTVYDYQQILLQLEQCHQSQVEEMNNV